MQPKWHRILTFLIFGAHALIFLPAIQAQSTGKISGVVIGDDGILLSAVVTAHRMGMPAANGRAEAAADGAFAISGLPPGTYGLCAAVKGGGYLDPCAWSAVIPSVQLDAGKTVTGFHLKVAKGDVLQVRVNDQSQALESSAAPGKSAPHVIVAVITERHIFQPLSVTSKDASGRNHEGTIPFDQDVSLHLAGNGVALKDAAGASLDPNGATVTVRQPSGNAPQPPLVFSVNPAKPQSRTDDRFLSSVPSGVAPEADVQGRCDGAGSEEIGDEPSGDPGGFSFCEYPPGRRGGSPRTELLPAFLAGSQ